MQPQTLPTPLPISKSGVCVADGYGIRLRVERGRLVVSDGFGPQRREGRFARATSGLRRLVLLGHTGFVTLGAIRWLADVGVGWSHLDPDGRVLATSAGYGVDHPPLRRAQALAYGTPAGNAIARDLLERKLDGQLRVAATISASGDTVAAIQVARDRLAAANSPDELMVIEAAAASSYWAAWADMPVEWVRSDLRRVPDGWQVAGPRTSPLTGSPRRPVTPVHAMLGYLYGVAEGEATLACLAMGLDPGLPVLHAPMRARNSLALDCLEGGIRADIDTWVLELVRSSVFRFADFAELRDGGCRILPPLSHRLAETAPHWAQLLAPVVERVAQMLADSPKSGVGPFPTRLTQANRSAGRDRQRRRLQKSRSASVPRSPGSICRGCGMHISQGRRWCDDCRPEVKLQAGRDGLAAARSLRARLHRDGLDPATSPASRVKQRDARLRRRAEEVAWDNNHPERPTQEVFRHTVLPAIAGIPIRRLANATGLSIGYCGLIRRGLRVPHPRWWEALTSA